MSTNPALASALRVPAGYAAPSARVTTTSVMSRFGSMMALVIASACVTWSYVDSHPDKANVINLAAIAAAFVLGIVALIGRFGQVWAMLAYSVAEGATVGAISQVIDTRAPGHHLASTAVLATLCVFASAWVLVSTGIITVNSKFVAFLSFAMIGYALFGLVNLVLQLTHIVDGWGVYSMGPLGIAISAIGVLLASACLVTSISQIKQAEATGAESKMSWMLGFGLVMDVVWLYIEILRLLSIVSRD